jgi:hypothetical protein
MHYIVDAGRGNLSTGINDCICLLNVIMYIIEDYLWLTKHVCHLLTENYRPNYSVSHEWP